MRAQTRLTQYLLDPRLKPTAPCVDNECPEALKIFFRDNSIRHPAMPAKLPPHQSRIEGQRHPEVTVPSRN